MKVGSIVTCVIVDVVAEADLGSGGRSRCGSLSGKGAFSVCGAGVTGGNDVSILSVFAFCPDNLLALTVVSFTMLAGLDPV